MRYETAALALGLAAGLLGNMVHMTVELFHSRIQVQMLWLVIGLLLAVPRIARRESELPANIGPVEARL